MMHLFFTRHGESQANVERVISNRELPHQLTATGRAQAAALADQLVGRHVTSIYCSPILRARETGALVAARLQVPLLLSDALREWDCGEMEGRGDGAAWAAHQAAVAAWAQGDWHYAIPGGESFTAMQQRFVPFVQGLIDQFGQRDQALLLIGHGSLLYHMLPLVVDNLDAAFLAAHALPNCVLIETIAQAGQLTCCAWNGERVA